jgi:hypothetical protein
MHEVNIKLILALQGVELIRKEWRILKIMQELALEFCNNQNSVKKISKYKVLFYHCLMYTYV